MATDTKDNSNDYQDIETQIIEAMLENITEYWAQDRMKELVAEFLSEADMDDYEDDDAIIYDFKDYYNVAITL
jgi:hypothetical protein